MAPFEAVYGRRCRFPIAWFEHGKAKLYVTDLVKDAMEKVKLNQEQLRTTQSRQKSSLKRLADEGYYEIREEGKAKPQLDESLGYEDELVAIIARQDLQLRSKRIFAVKYEHLLQQMTIPEWKWDRITMDFVVKLPRTLQKFNVVWVIVDRLTKSAHFILVVTTYTSEKLAQIYIQEIVRLHGVPVSIISNRGPLFTSHFWRAVQSELGTCVELSTTFHPQTDGYYLSNIEMAPFEDLYGCRCRSPIGWFEPSEAKFYGTDLVKDALERTIKGILRFGKKGKLSPRFICPFCVEASWEVSYELALPPSLSGVHPVFHVSMFWRYHADLSHMLDFSTIQLDESLGYEEEPIAIIARQDRQLRSKRIFTVKVQWRGQQVEEATWESEEDLWN
ncbi:uncharacterized protein [Nicotiana sylvestris]|uniref:uncharacterized protein n=1 Tax=Nicotiana sylvestris TaxID=4096 RepID=UPI00388CD196